MRPSQDLAYRARNWFWYWRVRQISGLNNRELDEKCFGALGRRRHFERIEQSASDPNQMPIVNGKKLLELVDAWDKPKDGGPSPYSCATQTFESKFWFFLATRELGPAVYTEFIQDFAEKRGWTRATYQDYGLYKLFLGADEPAIEHGVRTTYSAMLHKLVNEGSPDAVAVLIALFREAIHQVELENAIAIRKTFNASIMWMGERLGIPMDVTLLIRKLADDRVLSNRWITEADWRTHTNQPVKRKISTRERITEFNEWVRWYTNSPSTFGGNGYGKFPLVPQSKRTEWLEEHRNFLNQVRADFEALCQTHMNLRDSLMPGNVALAEKARIQADGLLSHISPPHGDVERFYETRPIREIGGLPSAFPTLQRK